MTTGDVVYRENTENPDAGLALAWLPGESTLLTTVSGELVRLDVITGDTQTLTADLPRVDTLTLSPDGKFAALGGRNGDILLVPLNADEMSANTLQTLTGHTDNVTQLNYLNPSTLVSGSRDTTVRVWQLNTENAGLVLAEHQDWVLDMAVFTSEGVIATGGRDRQLILWDAASGQMLGNAFGFPDWVLGAHYTLSGNLIVVTHNGQITRWAGTPSSWQQVASDMLH